MRDSLVENLPPPGKVLPEPFTGLAAQAGAVLGVRLFRVLTLSATRQAMKAYRDGTLPFPDGSILVKLSWKREPLDRFDGVFAPGPATMVQVMVKDSKKYAATGGWEFGRFINGKPVDEAQHKTCFACHTKTADVKAHDFVFTRLAP
ncbi:MAG: cytochrome P460 family protein [Gemmataceae bacterium]